MAYSWNALSEFALLSLLPQSRDLDGRFCTNSPRVYIVGKEQIILKEGGWMLVKYSFLKIACQSCKVSICSVIDGIL